MCLEVVWGGLVEVWGVSMDPSILFWFTGPNFGEQGEKGIEQ